jgi:chromosome segregation ATPase
VFSQFRDAVKVAGAEEQINFLAFWSGAYEGKPWAFDGTTAAVVALQVVAVVGVVLLFQLVVGVVDTSSRGRDASLHNLITEASLAFARKRAIRPEELAGSIKLAADELERGLKNLTESFENTKALVVEVKGLTGEITNSAALLKTSSEQLAGTMEPLKTFGATASAANDALTRAVASLESAERAFAAGVGGNKAAMEGAQSLFAETMSDNVAALDDVRRGVSEAAGAVSAATKGLDEVVVSATKGLGDVVRDSSGVSSEVAKTARELREALSRVSEVAGSMGSAATTARDAAVSLNSVVTSADTPQVQGYITAVEKFASLMTDSADRMVKAVQHMSEQLRQWTEDGR